MKGIEKEYQDLHASNQSKLAEKLKKDATEQKETLFEILSSVTDIRMNLEKGQVSSMEKDVKFENVVKKIEESVEKVKKIEESVRKMIEANENKKVNYYSDILGSPNPYYSDFLRPPNPIHTSTPVFSQRQRYTPIIQTNNVSMHFTNVIQNNIARLQTLSPESKLQRRRRRCLVDEEDAAIFWQEALGQYRQGTNEP